MITSGATRLDEMEDDNLTHIIVAQNSYDKKWHVVSLNLLLESIKQNQPGKESNYQVEIPPKKAARRRLSVSIEQENLEGNEPQLHF